METKNEAAKRLKYLSNIIRQCDIEYYVNNKSMITDAEYDLYRAEYNKLINQYSDLSERYPINVVGVKLQYKKGDLPKIKHSVPMLSLNNGFTDADIEHFINNIKQLHLKEDVSFCCEYKIDGLSFSALYADGILVKAATRGDGYHGEDITRNIIMIDNFPTKIDDKSNSLTIHGEVYMTKLEFENLNKHRRLNGEEEFATARNAAAGSLRQLDAKITQQRNLRYFAYSAFKNGEFAETTQSATLQFLKNLGFKVEKHYKVANDSNEIFEFYNHILKERDSLKYDIDGVVYKLNSLQSCKEMGSTSKYPRYAIAHKFPAQLGKTKLIDITFQVGKTGTITPVAELEPLKLQGVTITRATLHNFEDLHRKDIRKNDIIHLARAGDVIPKIVGVDIDQRDPNQVQKILPPDNCPACHSKLYKDNTMLYCTNRNCFRQVIEKLAHCTSQAAFNIDGLGKQQIQQLYDGRYITNIADIFTLKNHYNELILLPGLGEKSVNKILDAIEVASSNMTLTRFIYGLCIKHIGLRTSAIFANYFHNDIDALLKIDFHDSELIDNLRKLENVGGIVAQSFIEYFVDEINMILVKRLAELLHFPKKQHTATKLSNKVVAVTGTLTVPRNDIKNIVESLGGIFTNNVSSKTDILIYGDKSGSKLKQAEKLHITTFTEQEWNDFITR